ncbi:MAG: hypothetical protein J6D30_04200 [Clostridia bacterium]|nr:hypothetical protein [Clostridia bacterium]
MKTKFGKWLHLLELDVLLLGLFEKLALWLIKKLERRLARLLRSLEKARQYRNVYAVRRLSFLS